MAYGDSGRGCDVSWEARTRGKVRMSLLWSSLMMFSLSEANCSEVKVSDCEISGMILVRCDSRRRYSISTGLTPDIC